MGYNLTIGELKVTYDSDFPDISLDAKGEKHDNAPAFGEPTDYTNERWPSYSAWSNFCEFAGITELMGTCRNKRDDALIYQHPGVVPLTEKHRAEVNKAMDNFKAKYPDAKPTYGDKTEENPECNSYMCRLVWLHYWVNWAMDNCEQPVFANS